MKIATRQIDHLVYCVHNLDNAIDLFRTKYGIQPNSGGTHTNQGTHNAIINLGNQCYLELLAIDKKNHVKTKDRWMGIDLIESSKMTRWALKSQDISTDLLALKNHNPRLATRKIGARINASGQLLSWKMTMPLSKPEVELIPFLIDWSESDHHPTQNLEQSCSLEKLELCHPNPDELSKCFEDLGIPIDIIKSNSIKIRSWLKGPKGDFVL